MSDAEAEIVVTILVCMKFVPIWAMLLPLLDYIVWWARIYCSPN